ncbi:MAG: enoyl-CoA hydratase/isomerase family protein, partial [Acidimicrobiales bacterium]
MADYGDLRLLGVEVDGGVATVTIDNPPMNLLSVDLMRELNGLHRLVDQDDAVKVVVFVSADRDFFIAHAEAGDIAALEEDLSPPRDEIVGIHRLMERWRTCSKPTIAQIEGRTRGGGSEFVMSLDMRYAAIGSAVLAQPETAVGIIPAGSGTQRLAELCGRDRALEIALGCGDYEAEVAERYGWITRALPADQISDFVRQLAQRIASFPAAAVAASKRSVLGGCIDPVPGLITEEYEYRQVRSRPFVAERMQRIQQLGFGRREAELGDISEIYKALAES